MRNRQTGRGGLLNFVSDFWDILEPATELVDGWPLEAICLHLEAVTFGDINRLLINVPPGFMKSLLVNVFWPAWEWGPMNMPHLRYLAFSYALHLTMRDNDKLVRLVSSPRYRELWGDRFELTKTGAHKPENDRTGYKFATSIEGVGTGERGDRVLLDDPHNVIKIDSQGVMEKTIAFFRTSMSNRLNDMVRSAIVVVMQRLSETDVSGNILEREANYCYLMIPMEFESARYPVDSDGTTVLYEGNDIGWIDPRALDDNGDLVSAQELASRDGELAWAKRFSRNVIENDIKSEQGPTSYCTPAEAPILMADLSMNPIGEIKVGDEIIGWSPGSERTKPVVRRKLVPARVLSISKSVQRLVRMRLESGAVIRCTLNHKWYTGRHDPTHRTYKPATVGTPLMRVCDASITVLTDPEEIRLDSEDHVVSIELDTEEPVYGLETTTGNYVVWGLASSNSGQYQQSPVNLKGGIFQRDWWQPYHVPTDGPRAGKFPDLEYVVVSVDPAFTEKEQNDPTGCTTWGLFYDEEEMPRLIMLSAWRKHLQIHGSEQAPQGVNESMAKYQARCMPHWGLVEWIVYTAGRFGGADAVLVEAKASGLDVINELKRLYSDEKWGVIAIKPNKDKVARALSVQPTLAGGIIYAPYGETGWKDWADLVINEMALFPKGRFDDLTDSSTQAWKWLREQGLIRRPDEIVRQLEFEKSYEFVKTNRKKVLYHA